MRSLIREVLPLFSSANLIRMRKERGFTQEEVARRSGLATVTISKLEEGRNIDPKMSTVTKLIKALECSPNDFFEQSAIGIGDGSRT